jgi:hypothetical protein
MNNSNLSTSIHNSRNSKAYYYIKLAYSSPHLFGARINSFHQISRPPQYFTFQIIIKHNALLIHSKFHIAQWNS